MNNRINQDNGVAAASAPSRALPLLLAMAIFMQMLDATILNTALPAIAADLKESPLDMQLAVVPYALTVALLIPLSGYLADRFGTKRVFLVSMAVFVAGSALCAFSDSLPMLAASRVVQGVGGSMLVPVPRLTILKVYDKSRLLNAINYAVMPALVGPLVGPVLGGYLVEYTSWHWIFLVNLPIGLAGIALGLRIMPDVRDAGSRLDMAGYLLFAFATGMLSVSVEMLSHNGGLGLSVLPAVFGLLAGWLYLRHMKTAQNPIYAVDLFRIRTFRLGLAGNLFSRLGISSIPFLMPLMFQLAFGFGAGVSGWLMAPVALASLAVKPVIKPLMTRFGYRCILIWNTRILAGLIVLLGVPGQGAGWAVWVVLLLLLGACNSIQFSAMNTLTLADLRPRLAGSGNSLMAVNQQLAIALGIVAGALILQFWTRSGVFLGDVHAAFRMTLFCVGLVTFVSSFVFRRLHGTDGRNLTEAAK